MKLLALAWAYSNYKYGGEVVPIYELTKALAKQGVEVTVVTPTVALQGDPPDGVRLVQTKPDVRVGFTGVNKARMIRAVRRLLKEERYDVCHLISQITSFPILLRPFLTSVCYMEAHGAGSGAGHHLRELYGMRGRAFASKAAEFGISTVLNAIGVREEATLRGSDVIIARQKGAVAFFQKYSRVEYIPFGVNVKRFHPGTADGSILFVGNLLPYKGPDVLLRAFAKIAGEFPESELRLAGEGPMRPELEHLASELGIGKRVRFLGLLSYEELPKYYAQASAFCLPSKGEGYASVNLEAMASGVPPVTSVKITGVTDYLEDGVSGFILPPEDIDGFAQKLRLLLSDRTVRDRMGRAAWEKAQGFSWERIASSHLSLYQGLVDPVA